MIKGEKIINIFNICVGCATIISCLISIYSLKQVKELKNKINVKQTIEKTNIKNSNVNQIGVNFNSKENN